MSPVATAPCQLVQEAAAQAAAAMEAAQAARAEVHSALGVLQQQLDPAETLAAAKKVASVSSSVADLEAAAALTKASLRALEEQAHGLRASNTEVQQRLSALNQRSTTLEQSIQVGPPGLPLRGRLPLCCVWGTASAR